MKKYAFLIAAVAFFLFPFSAFTLNTPSLNSINTPALWIPNTASSTITPNPSSLKVPCANIVGGCGISSSSAVTSFNGATGTVTGVGSITGTSGQINVSAATGSVTLSLPDPVNVNTLNASGTVTATAIGTYQYFPKPTTLAASLGICGTHTGVGEVGACFADILSDATASGTVVYMNAYNYPSSSWTSQLSESTNQKFLTIRGVEGGTILNWGGTGTSTVINAGSSASASGYIAHPNPYGISGVTFVNAAGHGSSNTGMIIGGSNGSEGFILERVRFQGWGGSGAVTFGNNAFSIEIRSSQFADNKFHIIVPGGLTNSTERIDVHDNQFGDCFSGVATTSEQNCLQFTNTSFLTLRDNQYDDAQVVFHSGVWLAAVVGGQCEDPALVAGTHFGYSCFKTDDSATTYVTISNVVFVHDGTTVTSTAPDDISCGSNMTITGAVAVFNGSGSGTSTAQFITRAGANCKYTATGIVNLSGTAFVKIDDAAPTALSGLNPPWASYTGTSTPAFAVSSGTVTGTFDQFNNIQKGRIFLSGAVASETLTFAKPWVSIPICFTQDASTTGTNSIIRSQLITTSSYNFQDSTPLPTSSVYNFRCEGNPN